eukprot:721183-Pelagomonas_calceolata.AAC.2
MERVQKLTDAHEKQVAQLRQEVVQAQSDMVGGEIEAVRHVMGCQVEDANVQVSHWQHRQSEEACKRLEAEEAASRAEEHLKKVRPVLDCAMA